MWCDKYGVGGGGGGGVGCMIIMVVTCRGMKGTGR